jgi:hypothetical protein
MQYISLQELASIAAKVVDSKSSMLMIIRDDLLCVTGNNILGRCKIGLNRTTYRPQVTSRDYIIIIIIFFFVSSISGDFYVSSLVNPY